MRLATLLVLPFLCFPMLCRSEEVRSARELAFREIFATRQDDPRLYVVLGGGWLLTISRGDPFQFVSDWVAKHPDSTVTPISRMFSTNTRTKITEEMVYIWVEDGRESLNVDLMRAGLLPGSVMIDMVELREALDALLKDPKHADLRAEIEKERAEAPQDRVERLIPDADYRQRMEQIEIAERAARGEGLGIWADSAREEREAEGYP